MAASPHYAAISPGRRDEEGGAAEEAALLRAAPGARAGGLSRCGFSHDGGEPAEWKEAIDGAFWYQLSCFAYCVAGGLTLLRPEPLERHLPVFPWRVCGLSVVTNGFFSYMSDVETWGRPSRWKSADRVLATCNTLLQLFLVVLSWSRQAYTGVATFPAPAIAALSTGVGVALVCKHRAAAAMGRRDRPAFVWWHSAWHYTLPAGAVVGQLLLHRPCDYASLGFGANCACTPGHVLAQLSAAPPP